jgi:tetratricopeptide (TPR) repeat protein
MIFKNHSKYLTCLTLLRKIIIYLTLIILFQGGFAQTSQHLSVVNIGIINFIYLADGGYDPYTDDEGMLEKTIIFPAIEKGLEHFDIYNYSLKYERVNGGKLDYAARSLSSGTSETNEFDQVDYDIIIWGLVTPVRWPDRFDLQLFLISDSKLLYRTEMKINKGEILIWDGKRCTISQEVIGIFPVIPAILKMDQQSPNNDPTTQISHYINTNYGKMPATVENKLLKNDWHKSLTAESRVVDINYEFENGTSYCVGVDQTCSDILVDFIESGEGFNWYLEHGGLLMPEILIKLEEPIFTLDGGNRPEPISNFKYLVKVLPIKNLSGITEYDWIGFGIEYQLSNKFSELPQYHLAQHNRVEQSQNKEVYTTDLENEIQSLDYIINGQYTVGSNQIAVSLDFTTANSDEKIAAVHYTQRYDNFLDMIAQAAHRFTHATDVILSPQDEQIVNHKLTNSMVAFENFCMGYLESAKSGSDHQNIVRYFTRAINEDPDFREARYNLGVAYYNNKDYEDAIRQFQTVLATYPEFKAVYLARGLTYMQLEEFIEANRDFNMYVNYNPDDYHPYYYLGHIAVKQKKYFAAQNYLSTSLELNPTHGDTYFELGNIFYLTSRYREAIDHYKKVINLEPDHLEARRRLGEGYYRMHNFNGAKEEFGLIVTLLPNDAVANFMMGVTIYKQAALNDYIDSFLKLAGWKKNTADKNRNIENKHQRQVYNRMVHYFKAAQQSNADFYEATFNLALTYQEQGKLDSALYYLKKTLKIKPDLIKGHMILARYYENQGNLDQALSEYKQVALLDPSYVTEIPEFGPRSENQVLIDNIVKELLSDLKADPDNIDYNLRLANIFYAQGYRGKAANLYRKILLLDPGEAKAQQGLARIEKGL